MMLVLRWFHRYTALAIPLRDDVDCSGDLPCMTKRRHGKDRGEGLAHIDLLESNVRS